MKLIFDSKAARASDAGGVIRESGKYDGLTITRAEILKSLKGTVGLGLSVQNAYGQSCNYLNIWHTRGSGEYLSGWRTISKIMACLRLKTADEGQIKITKWDNGKPAEAFVPGYPEMMGKKIGLLLQEVWETNSETGANIRKMEIFAPFEAGTELTAAEILDRKTAPGQLGELLERMIAQSPADRRQAAASRPAARPVVRQSAAGGASAAPSPRPATRPAAPAPATSFDDMDDDLPF